VTSSVIIVSYNACSSLRQCLTALHAHPGGGPLEVWVVDNASADDSPGMVAREFPDVHLVVNPRNLGFAAANVQVYGTTQGTYLILLNPDAVVEPDTINTALAFMAAEPDCGICGVRLLTPDGRPAPSARRFPNVIDTFFAFSGLSTRFPASRLFARSEFRFDEGRDVIEVDWVPGAFTVLRREMLEQVGFFDERFFLYYEETDLCLRAKRAGWRVCCLGSTAVRHVGGVSSRQRDDEHYDAGAAQVLRFRLMSECLYFRKHGGLLPVLANLGIEIAAHGLRFVLNMGRGDVRRAKRRESARIIRHAFGALRATRCGRISPPKPW